MSTEGFSEAMDFLKDEGAVAHTPEAEDAPTEDTQTEDTPAEDSEDEPEAPSEEAPEPDPEDAAEPEPEAMQPDHDWEKRYKDLQSYTDKRLKEQEEKYEQRIAQENYQRQIREQQAMQAQQQQAMQERVQAITPDVIHERSQRDPVGTFQMVTQARPDLMPNLLAALEEHHGPEIARQAHVAATNAGIQQTQQSVEARMNELEERLTAPTVIRNGLEQMVGALSETYGGDEAFAPVANELLNRVSEMAKNGQSLPPDPDAVYNFLERNVLDIMRGQITSASQEPAGPREVDTSVLGESGGTKAPPSNPDEEFVEGLVGAFNEMKYGSGGPQ